MHSAHISPDAGLRYADRLQVFQTVLGNLRLARRGVVVVLSLTRNGRRDRLMQRCLPSGVGGAANITAFAAA